LKDISFNYHIFGQVCVTFIVKLKSVFYSLALFLVPFKEEHQRAAMDQIFHADRQSLLAEIRDLRAHSNISSIRHQEERERLSDQLNDIEDQSNKRERQLKRQGELSPFFKSFTTFYH